MRPAWPSSLPRWFTPSVTQQQSWVTTQTRPPSGGVAEPRCPFPACSSRGDSLMRLIKKEKGRSHRMVFLHPSGRFFSSAGLYCPQGSGAGSIWQLKHLSHQVGVTGALLMLGLVWQPPWGSAGPCCSLGSSFAPSPPVCSPGQPRVAVAVCPDGIVQSFWLEKSFNIINSYC